MRDDGADGLRVGRIVEVEAYGGEQDRASHARSGRTRRNAPMYGPPGVAYVYRVYGMHRCLNVVTEPAGTPAAVLVRAVEPVAGVDAMRRARAQSAAGPTDAAHARIAALAPDRLARGPGLVGAAFSVTVDESGADLCAPGATLRLAVGDPVADVVLAGPRIGVSYAAEPWASIPWRLWLGSSRAVSGRRRREPR